MFKETIAAALMAGGVVAAIAYAQNVDPGTASIVAAVNAINAGCTPYHFPTTASTNATVMRSTAGRLCDLLPINMTSTPYYLKIYDVATTPTCSSATGLKHVFPIPENAANGGGFARVISMGGEIYTTGIAFCVTASGTDTANDAAAVGVYIEASHK